MRAQWCREHIDETAEHCGLKKSTISEVKLAASFCESNSAFAECGSRAITRLLRVRDDDIKNIAISLAEKALKELTPTGGKKRDRLTEPEIKEIIKKAENVIGGEDQCSTNVCSDNYTNVKTCTSSNDVKKHIRNDSALIAEQVPEIELLPPPLPADAPMNEVLKRDDLLLAQSRAKAEHDRRLSLAKLLHKKQESTWKPRHIAREELISELTDQYLTPVQLTAIKDLIESGEVKDEIDAILWIVDRYQEMQDSAS